MNVTLPGATVMMPAAFKVQSPTTIVRQEDERILQYLCGLVAWTQPQRVSRLVITENSNTRFDFTRVTEHVRAAGKELEVLVFQGTPDAARLGQGFGEGELLEYMFTHSRLLRAANTFYKVTGRIFVKNFDEIDANTTSDNVFHRKARKPPKPSKANTVFFKCSREVFETRLLHAYRDINEPHGINFEQVYYNGLRGLDAPDFSIGPILVGQQASTGKHYEPYDQAVVDTARSLM